MEDSVDLVGEYFRLDLKKEKIKYLKLEDFMYLISKNYIKSNDYKHFNKEQTIWSFENGIIKVIDNENVKILGKVPDNVVLDKNFDDYVSLYKNTDNFFGILKENNVELTCNIIRKIYSNFNILKNMKK